MRYLISAVFADTSTENRTTGDYEIALERAEWYLGEYEGVYVEIIEVETGDVRWSSEDPEEEWNDDPFHGDDAAADADVLRSAGMGTDEDYGFFGYEDEW